MTRTKKTVSLDEFKEEVKEGKVQVDKDQPTPFAEALQKYTDDFEGCTDIDQFCDVFKFVCEEANMWDSKHKEYCIRLRKAEKVPIAFTMIWNWILGGQPNKNYTAR